MSVPGQIIGDPGAAAGGSGLWESFDGGAKYGLVAERQTAEVLNEFALKLGGPTVLHNLFVPGAQANIDHVLVSGRKILLLDSKRWRPGFYWTLGSTRRGWTKVSHADTKTLPFALDRLAPLVPQAKFAKPLMVVWPSSTQPNMSLWAFRPAGAHAVSGQTLGARLAARRLRSADPSVVSALLPYVRR